MSAKAFVPMAKAGRIPRKAKVEEGVEGGSLLQVLGAVEVDILQRVLAHLDPVTLMRVEASSAALRRFMVEQSTWRKRGRGEGVLEVPAVAERWCREEAGAPAGLRPLTPHLRAKARSTRAWNLRLNWRLGQTKASKLVSFNCNHEGCGEKCRLRRLATLNPAQPSLEDLLPTQVVAGDLVVISTFNQYSTDEGRTMFYSIREGRLVELFPPTAGLCSLLEAPLSPDRSRLALLYWVPGPEARAVQVAVVEAATYRVQAAVEVPLSAELARLVYTRPGEGDVAWLDNSTLLFFLHDTLVVLEPLEAAVVRAVVQVPQLEGHKVQVSGRHLCGLQARQVLVLEVALGEQVTVTEVWRKTFAATSFPPVNLTSVRLAFPWAYIGKSVGVLETWQVATDTLATSFDKCEVVASPRPAILDIKVLQDRLVTSNFGGHLCVWDRAVLEGTTTSAAPAYKLELKYEQDYYVDETQVVFIEEMGARDMELMTVSRRDLWAVAGANLEAAARGQPAVARAGATYGGARRRVAMDPRKRKVGNAGIPTLVKRPALEPRVEASQGVEEYAYREEEQMVHEELEVEREEEREEEYDYHYQDGEGLD